MSEVKFVGSIVAKLEVSKGMNKDSFDYFNNLVRHLPNASITGDENYFEVEFRHTYRVETNIEDEWVIRKVIVGGDEDILKVNMKELESFKSEVEHLIGKNLNLEDVSVQAYNWYNCSEEPLS